MSKLNTSIICHKLATCKLCQLYANPENWIEFPELITYDNYGEVNTDLEFKNRQNLFWYYSNFTIEELITQLHNDNIIKRCKTVVDEFYTNIANNKIPEGAYENIISLYDIGCYIKQYIEQLITDLEPITTIQMLIEQGTLNIFRYYLRFANISSSFIINLYKTIFLNK